MDEIEDNSHENHQKHLKKRLKRLPWNQDVSREFFLPQVYQIKLIDIALKNNILIFTRKQDLRNYLIVTVLREYSFKLEEKKKLLLVVNENNRYKDLILRHSTLNVDEDPTSQSNVLILSITQLNDYLKRGLILSIDIKLVIYDEILDALDNPCYKIVMDLISNQTHIIGMSLLQINDQSNSKEIKIKFDSLKSLFKCDFIECATDLLDTNNQLNNIKLKEIIEVCDNSKESHFSASLMNQITETLNFLNDINIEKMDNKNSVEYIHLICVKVIKECIYLINHVGIWCFSKSLLPFICQIDKLCNFFESKNDCKLEKYLLQFISTQLRSYREQCVRELFNFKAEYPKRSDLKNDSLIERFCTPKIRTLFNLLKQNSNINDKFCALIYVQNKQVAITLSLLIKKLSNDDSKLNYINSNYIINSSIQSENDLIDEQTQHSCDSLKQEEIIRKFHSGQINLLICTYEIEEVINVPNNCTIIIHFDVNNLNYSSFILAKSRLKPDNEPNKVVFICEKSEFYQFFINFSNIKEIENILSKKYSLLLTNKTNITYFKPLDVHQIDVDTSRLNNKNPIELLNRYCVRLPSDSLTQLTVDYHIERNQFEMYLCRLSLPINSPLRDEIYGELSDSLKKSIESCASKACILLRNIQELNDNFEAISKEQFCKKEQPFDSFDLAEWGTFKNNRSLCMNSRPGGSKRKQIYAKKISTYLLNSTLNASHTCYLYVFKFSVVKSLFNENPNEFLKENRHFALISQKFMLEIPDFSIFTQNGEENIEFKLVKSNFFLTPNQIKLVKNFHEFIFSNVLRMQRSPVFYETNSNGAYVCLVEESNCKEGYSIDWEMIKKVENITDKVLLNVNNENFVFNPNSYNNAVIIPYYRAHDHQPQFYCVQSIDYEQNPLSKFPSNNINYSTFYDYYMNKYHQIITDLNQPMLIVSHPSTRLNLLTPRYMNLKASVLQKSFNPSKSTSNKIYLVPELVKVHPFSATLWKRSLCLPSILYRLNNLLLAEELRREIAQSTGIGVPWASDSHKFDRLEFHWDTKKEIEVLNMPDLEVEITSKFESAATTTTITTTSNKNESNIWDFEISTWDDSCLKQHKKDNTQKSTVSNGWLDSLSDNKTLFIDINDMSYFDDNLYDDDYEEQNGINTDGSNDDYNLFHFDSKIQDELINTNHANEDDDEDDENKQVSRKFSINLNNLKNDLKQKSAKLLSKLNISNGEVKHLLNNETKEEQMNQNEFEILEYIKDSAKNDDLSLKTTQLNGSIDLNSLIDSKSIWLASISLNINLHNSRDDKILALKNTLDSIKLEIYSENEENFEFINKLDKINIRNYNINGQKHIHGCLNNQKLPFPFSLDYKAYDSDTNFSPGPSILLQALTLTNAGDGFDLERLETVGDSFLKQAITVYLFYKYPKVNEGKLSYLRSKQVSNYNLYKLGKQKGLAELIISNKFEPLDTWLPLHYDTKQNQTIDDILSKAMRKMLGETNVKPEKAASQQQDQHNFNKYRQHIVSDKSIADCVEAIIGAYLISSGAQAALRIMNWFGLEVLPKVKSEDGSELYVDKIDPIEPIIKNPGQLEYLTDGFYEFEKKIGYCFRNKAYLLQAFTHASYYFNEITDCYQRLEFLGDAILDYLITRYLYEDPKKHSPGELTDLRSSLVNNNIFAHLAVKFEFYKFFKYLSPSIFTIIDNYIKNFNESDLDDDLIDYLYQDDDDEFMEHGPKDELLDDYEELEVPKCLGDIFESVAGAIFLDSQNSFDTVWKVFYALMKPYIDKYTERVPKSPIRELLEMEPETVKFENPERTIDGKIRVTVSVFGKGKFKGIGRSYRIAKNAAAKSALKYIKKEDL